MTSKKEVQEQSGVLSAEQMMLGAKPRVVRIPFRELGGAVRLRELTRQERLDLPSDQELVLPHVLRLTLVEPQLTAEQITALFSDVTVPLYREMDDKIARLNRLGSYKDLTPEEVQAEAFREPAGQSIPIRVNEPAADTQP